MPSSGDGHLRFRILGPLEVRRDDVVLPIDAPRQQALLAALLLHANQAVPVDRLTEYLWGDEPPETARNTLQTLVLRLRRLLDPTPAAAPVLVTRAPGYLIRVEPGRLDLHRFEELVGESRSAASVGDMDAAAGALRQALALWRGPALGEVRELQTFRAEVAWLEERRMAALEERVAAELELGRHRELVGELRTLVAEHPLRERLWGQLMLALCRADRRAEALRAYQEVYRLLDAELGVPPGAALQRLHRQMLDGDHAFDLPAQPLRAQPRPAPPAAVPRQLPAGVPDFTGRAEQLKELDNLLQTTAGAGRAVVISAIAGTAGIGKTALAVHWAHQVADRFPDGQLYVNLRGFDPTGAPTTPAEAVRGFLQALGVTPEQIPTSLDAQAALYRSLLADRRMLVVLDNARDAEQVRPLLPGSASGLVVVTSRDQLASLVAIEGARCLAVDLFTPGEAHELLTRRLTPGRLAAEPRAVDQIIARCAGLPLALAIVAARAAARPEFPLASLAGQLRHTRHELDAFAGDDPLMDLRAVFSWSYRALSAPAARLFRQLGRHPGPDIGAPAVASLSGLGADRTRPLLAELARAHLVTEHIPGRYAFHDLLRAYAVELANSVDPDAERAAALRRVLDHYLHTAYAANQLLNPHHDPIVLVPPGPEVTPEVVEIHAQALAWFTAEYPVLLAAIDLAGGAGFDVHAWQLAWLLTIFLDRRGLWHDLVAAQRTALAAARRLADRPAQARVHRALAAAYGRLGRFDEAHANLRQALDLCVELSDRAGQAHAHYNIARACFRQRRHRQALDHAAAALDLYRAAGQRSGEGLALNAVGWYHAQLGDHRQALDHCGQALAIHQEIGHPGAEAATWDSLGYAHHQLGDHRQAADCYRNALRLYRSLGDRYYEADTLTHLGDSLSAAGDLASARAAWRRGLDTLEELGHPDAEAVHARLAVDTG